LKNYVKTFKKGEVLKSHIIGEVVESNNNDYKVGDLVLGVLPWQDYNVWHPRLVEESHLHKLDYLPKDIPMSAALGVLGLNGMTAYFGLLDIGKPEAGETVVVSAAAGATGSLVGQIAKLKGCRVIGITGSADKVEFIKQLGFDEGINYKEEENLSEAIRRVCPDGVDIYWDDVGGFVSDAVMENLSEGARIVLCGQMSVYSASSPKEMMGPRNDFILTLKNAKKVGFSVFNWADRFPEGRQEMSNWLENRKIKYKEHVVEGLENAPCALIDLFEGANIGKMIIKCGE